MDSPRLHPAYDENSDEATKAEALVNMKRSEDLGKQLNVLEARLKEIRTENEEEAYELEGEYRVLAKEAEESGDHTKLDEFEKRLRMRKGRVEKVGE